MTMRASSCAGTSFRRVPALAYGVRRPSTITTSRDMRLLGRLVHRFDQAVVAAFEDAAFDFERWRNRSICDRQVRREEREGANLLVVSLVHVVGVDLPLIEASNLWI